MSRSSPTLSIIVAMTQRDWIIGRDNKLPWHAPEDLKYFKGRTTGAPIVMGRKTYDSIGRPLPARLNVVLSRQARPDNVPQDVLWVATLPEALSEAARSLKEGSMKGNEIFVIGGAQLFAEALPMAGRLYITWVGAPYEGDVRFPQVALEHDFKLLESRQGASLDPPLKFAVYERL
jgi:dihydrofolate reductase